MVPSLDVCARYPLLDGGELCEILRRAAEDTESLSKTFIMYEESLSKTFMDEGFSLKAVEERKPLSKIIMKGGFSLEEQNGFINPCIPPPNYRMCRQRRRAIPFAALQFAMTPAKIYNEFQLSFEPEIIKDFDSSKGIDRAAETIEQIDLDALIQRISIPETNPSWKDYNAYKKILEEFDEKSWMVHKERESGGFVGGKRPWDTHPFECMKQSPFESWYAGNQNRTDEAKLNFIQSVGNTLSGDLAVQPGLAKTYAILFRNLLDANLPSCERWKDVGSTMSLNLRDVLKKVLSMPFRDPNIVCNGLEFLKSTSKLAVGMVLIGNTPAVGAVRAMAPEAAAPGSLQTGDFEISSNFAFGVINSVGALFSIIAVFIAVKWRRRHSIAGTSAVSAPAGAILNRPVNMAQTLTVLRSWRETEYCEVMVASREEEGAYAS